MLRDGDRIWLLDFDTLARGHAEVDLATFIAHIVLDGLSADLSIGEIDQLTGTVLSEYESSGGRVDRNRFRFYLPSAMARLGAIHLARGMKPEIVAHFWDVAMGYLAGDLPGDR
ncbi:MAG: hypothetical protein IID05_14545 [Gemmatimonadetes bacterium]|nr:hypothetical protein [Gemmatimonadota bacterium]